MEIETDIFTALQQYTKALSVALKHRDVFTRRHSERVVGIAEEIALHCELTTNEINCLIIGATFHDVGKIGIPDSVLLKPGALTDDEWVLIKQHSEIGEDIFLATELEGAHKAARLIRHHHENFDGSGYPDNLVGEKIPLGARIIAIADGYDAIAMPRVYHQGRSHDETMELLNEVEGKYDPELMSMFRKLIKKSSYKVN
jgi:HD-GYP domain-containing protein (c-di-GMP phosphodiesterase class II)